MSPLLDGVGISSETATKQETLRYILGVHLRITTGLLKKSWAEPVYHYFDLTAGPGDCSQLGAQYTGPGSPLIFLEEAAKLGVDYRAVCFEQEECSAKRLYFKPNLTVRPREYPEW